ncbi:hypothetical protein HK405_013141, partial [Cladochytrium tenue]
DLGGGSGVTAFGAGTYHIGAVAATAAVPRVFTLFDDLPPLPSTDIQNMLLRESLQETQTALPILHRPSLALHAPHLSLALEAVASRFSGMAEEGRRIFERARRMVVPIVSGCAPDDEPSAGGSRELQSLQALAYLIFYCLLDGSQVMLAVGQRWLAMSIACARQLRLNRAVEVSDPIIRQSRIRLW